MTTAYLTALNRLSHMQLKDQGFSSAYYCLSQSKITLKHPYSSGSCLVPCTLYLYATWQSNGYTLLYWSKHLADAVAVSK